MGESQSDPITNFLNEHKKDPDPTQSRRYADALRARKSYAKRAGLSWRDRAAQETKERISRRGEDAD